MKNPRQLVAASAASQSGTKVPAQWNTQAVTRLRTLALIASGLGVLALPMAFLRQQNLGPRAGFERPLWVIPAFIAASLVMWGLGRSKGLSEDAKLTVGLGYLVVLAGIAGVFRHSLPYDAADVLRGFSPIVLGVVLFAVVIPTKPGRFAVAATLAALCDPLALLGFVAFGGHPMPPWNLWLWLFIPTALSVVVATMMAKLFFSLGQSLERAQRMGRYRLVELLGRGGMGEVWRAEHDTLARPAAIKLIRPDMLGQGDRALSLARFEREAQSTARLGSPHTIELYDYGVSEDGAFFYVMELLDGQDLADLLEPGVPLSASRAVSLLEQICHSLRDAHEQGVVHRDIKPANIYVCKKGSEYDFIKVLDFGLAKQVAEGEVNLTQTDSLTGTPKYMAPETIGGQQAGFAADVYAIGCVGYRMLTGRDVFEATGVMAVLVKHLHDPPQPLAEVAPAPVPSELADLVMRCLEKDPDRRPADAGALLEALEATGLGAGWTQHDAQTWWSGRTPQNPVPARAATDPADADALGETAPAGASPSDDETLAAGAPLR